MSLLYECINGIIQGGILGAADDGSEEIATLCVSKLRGMIMIDGDPNRKSFLLDRVSMTRPSANLTCVLLYSVKYVALLAFNKIVVTHPFLVAQQEDVILECIDSPDITIRTKALDLVRGMVSPDNLVTIVSRLMKQLRTSVSSRDDVKHDGTTIEAESEPDSDEEARVKINPRTREKDKAPPLPDDYRIDVIGRILDMCSRNNYGNLEDFDWYIDVLTQLVRMAPAPRVLGGELESTASYGASSMGDISEGIGDEIRNVAVKVRAMRPSAVRAADLILMQLISDTPAGHSIGSAVVKSISWVLGEYPSLISLPDDTLSTLLQTIPRVNTPETLVTCLQAVVKIFAFIAGNDRQGWTPAWKSRISLLMARIIDVLEPLALHPNLEVQERAVEFVELLKLTAEAVSGQPASTDDEERDPPLLLIQAIPSLFQGWELNSVAQTAQKNVTMPDGLDLDEPIHPNLNALLAETDTLHLNTEEMNDFEIFYHQRPAPTSISSSEPAIARLGDPSEEVVSSYQDTSEDSYLDPDIVARRKAERMERNRDDPFYIGGFDSAPRTSTPIHNILQQENGPDLDIDSIPIMQLDLGKLGSSAPSPSSPVSAQRPPPRPRQRVVVAADETLAGSEGSTPRNYESENNSDSFTKSRTKKLKQGLLQVDSSHIGSFSLEDGPPAGGAAAANPYDYERQQREEAEMAQAMKEVEKLRLEMQRANERVQVAQGVDAEGTVVKKKVKKKKQQQSSSAGGEDKVVKKKKKKKVEGDGKVEGQVPGEAAVVTKKKKKRKAPVEPLAEPAAHDAASAAAGTAAEQ